MQIFCGQQFVIHVLTELSRMPKPSVFILPDCSILLLRFVPPCYNIQREFVLLDMSVDVKILYFAGASTATGLTQETVSLPYKPFPLTSLASHLESLHPNTGLGKVLASSQWSVDVEMVRDPEETMLNGGEEVAVIPPVSGG